MTMLTHAGGPFEPAASTTEQRANAVVANARRATIRRSARIALTVLLLGTAIGGAIALKTAVYFWRIHT